MARKNPGKNCLELSKTKHKTLSDLNSSTHVGTLRKKSVETGLHSLVRNIEYSLNCKGYNFVAFLDIEGALNNVEYKTITKAMAKQEIYKSLIDLISLMLESRVI